VPVYDLTVEEDHEFFANGVLVHNSTHAGGCYTAGPLGGIVELGDNKMQIYLIEFVRGQWSIDKVEEQIKLWANIDAGRYGSKYETVVEEEGGSAGKQAAFDTMRNMRGLRVRIISTGGKSKISRWQPLANAVYRYEVFVVTTKDGKPNPCAAEFLAELGGQPKSQFRDMTDAAALVFNELIQPGYFDLPDDEPGEPTAYDSFGPCKNNLCDRLASGDSPYCCKCCQIIHVTKQDIREIDDAHDQMCNHRHGTLAREGEWQPSGRVVR
jgi:phage terminase large subunit-like protein